MSENQTQNVQTASPGRRIKFLRGELSQHEFARKGGVSRASLANYETSRTVPTEGVIAAISNALAIGPEFLTSGITREADGLLNLLGFGDAKTTVLTEKEWAIIQAFRVCPPDVVWQAVAIIAISYFDLRQNLVHSDPIGVAADLTRLQLILERDGQFRNGQHRDNRSDRLKALQSRLSHLKVDGNKGPQ